MGFHCVAHRANLTLQSLYDLIFIARLDSFVTNFYGYFNHSPKRHLEFQRLVHILETIGNKILKIVKTKWMSMLEPLKMIMVEYRPLLDVMQQDSNTKKKWQR
jgi:hypothetical protein